jgi:hypothetical protein
MEYRHPPLYHCIIRIQIFQHTGARRESRVENCEQEHPCTDIELIGKL